MIDRERARAAIAEFLCALGHDPAGNRELAETPARVTDAFGDELLSGYAVDVDALLADGSETASSSAPIVAVTGIRTATLCPHHLMPGLGTAAVVYKPGARVLGLGTLARLVDAFARRLTLQEAVSANVVAALMRQAQARGAAFRSLCSDDLRPRRSALSGRRSRRALRACVGSTSILRTEPAWMAPRRERSTRTLHPAFWSTWRASRRAAACSTPPLRSGTRRSP
jgi:GTP cyclohydrolase I